MAPKKAPRKQMEPVNPTLPVNWPSEPTTDQEFAEWLHETEVALRQWLNDSRERATELEATENQEDGTDRIKAAERKAASDAKWYQNWDSQIDVQTGTIFDTDEQGDMQRSISGQKGSSTKLHKKLRTWRKHVEFRYAQASWEDFLYYQNVWNRKLFKPGANYAETSAQKEEIKARPKLNADKEETAGLNETEQRISVKDGDVVETEAGTRTRSAHREESEDGEARRGTPGTNDMTKLDGDNPFWGLYKAWREHLLQLYTQFKLGYRKRMPAVVDPRIAHRYSQPTRGTTPQHLSRYRIRHDYLEERFPRKRRKNIDTTEVEERNRSPSERRLDRVLEAQGGMEDIQWRLDDVAFENMQQQTNTASGFGSDVRTSRLVPESHVLHHGCLETSFDWPTSFDSPDWGNSRLMTASRKGDVLQDTTDEDISDAETGQGRQKKRPRRWRRDEDGHPLKKLENRPRYETETTYTTGPVFYHTLNPDGTVVGRDRQGRWIGETRNGPVEHIRFRLDKDGNRIILEPQPIQRRTFSTWVQADVELDGTRPERHQQNYTTNQLSDNEDEGCVDSNANFGRFGNMTLDQVGNPTLWGEDSDREDNKKALGNVPSGSDGESDDEGDLFKHSYEECSEVSNQQHARELMARFKRDIGAWV